MLKSLLGIILIFGITTLITAQPASPSTKSMAWDMGDSLRLAGIAHADRVEKTAVGNLLAKAKANGKKFGVAIPELPVNTADKISNKAGALAYLLGKVGNPMGGVFRRDYDEEHALLFELSLKSNVLLMMYGPGESTTETISNVIKTRSERLGLPALLTANLLMVIAAKADYANKAAVFKMHRDVAKHLSTGK